MRPEGPTPAEDLARAVGALLQSDPARVPRLMASLRSPGRSILSTVQGMSMQGCLAPGSRIRIEMEPDQPYDVGMVIAFLAGEQLVVHRVVHRGRSGHAAGWVLTRGDAPLVPDAPVPQARILGRVSGVFKDGDWLAPGSAAPRSLRARVLSTGIVRVATLLLYLSPGLTARLLARLSRLEGALRLARNRQHLGPAPAPGRSR